MSEITKAKQAEFLEEIRGWPWPRVVENAKREIRYDRDSDGWYGRDFLGSIFNLTPSGKFYTPFACSNVTPCPHCNGERELPNPASDPVAYALLDRAQRELRLSTMASYGSYSFGGCWPMQVVHVLRAAEEAMADLRPTLTCEHCDGLGSEEARWDELFTEALERVAEENGGFIDYIDSDIFFVISGEAPEEDQDE